MAAKDNIYSSILDTFKTWDQTRSLSEFEHIATLQMSTQRIYPAHWQEVFIKSVQRGDTDLAAMMLSNMPDVYSDVFDPRLLDDSDNIQKVVSSITADDGMSPLVSSCQIHLGKSDTLIKLDILGSIRIKNLSVHNDDTNVDPLVYVEHIQLMRDKIHLSQDTLVSVWWKLQDNCVPQGIDAIIDMMLFGSLECMGVMTSCKIDVLQPLLDRVGDFLQGHTSTTTTTSTTSSFHLLGCKGSALDVIKRIQDVARPLLKTAVDLVWNLPTDMKALRDSVDNVEDSTFRIYISRQTYVSEEGDHLTRIEGSVIFHDGGYLDLSQVMML